MDTKHHDAVRVHFVTTIHFHGLTLAVFNTDGTDYIPVKPLCDMAGHDWKGAKRTLQSGDNVFLFGTKRLNPPKIEGWGNLSPPHGGDIPPDRRCLVSAS